MGKVEQNSVIISNCMLQLILNKLREWKGRDEVYVTTVSVTNIIESMVDA